MPTIAKQAKIVLRRIVPLPVRLTIRRWWDRFADWCYDRLPDTYVQRSQFKKRFGRRLNLSSPQTLNEKIHWLMRYYRYPIMTSLADKYAVRDYVAHKIGHEFLNELYGVWDDPAAIPFEALPESFVLKVTWGSGQNIMCRDRSKLDVPTTQAQLVKWMKRSEYWVVREWAYKNITPRVICERYLTDEAGNVPTDYKFFCFNGEPRFVQVVTGRFSNNHRRHMFDLAWMPLPFSMKYPPSKSYPNEFPPHQEPIQKPSKFEAMIAAAQALSKDLPLVRVDLYCLGGTRICFGEMTLYPEGGLIRFVPDSFDLSLGQLLTLPQ
jgi:hypothetical protein